MIPNDVEILKQVRLTNYMTPYFFTSRAILKHNYETFVNLFDNAEIYYALKANSDPKILSYLNGLGCGFEAASFFEIEHLLQVGVSASNIMYGTSVKPPEHIEKSFQQGITRFAADSKEEIDKIATCAPESRVFVRVIVDDTGSVFKMSERFGAPVEMAKELVLYARQKNLKIYGISFYVGSQATEAKRWANGLRILKPVIEELSHEGISLEMVNIGGGFPVLYDNHKEAPHLSEIVANIHNVLHQLPYIPKIIMEPGRGIVASSTVLVCTVFSRSVRNGRVWLCLDAGIYNALYEAMIHQGSTGYTVQPFIPSQGDEPTMFCTLAGPTGDSLDIIARHAVLPEYITVGDKLIFENTGAYTVTMASAFNGFPKPELYIG
ncbi:MAG: type III PLP-dependent enzyme [Patescibacteria group bacterium]